MVLLVIFLLGLVVGALLSRHICKSFECTDKLELTILKLQNERLTMDLEYHRNMAKQLEGKKPASCKERDGNCDSSCGNSSESDANR